VLGQLAWDLPQFNTSRETLALCECLWSLPDHHPSRHHKQSDTTTEHHQYLAMHLARG
jgi:hypothetical protein